MPPHDGAFVIQEHHARALHWDFRLEHDGVLVSWAIPKGVPADPRTNRLAVRVDDHELAHADYENQAAGTGQGTGRVTIWDRGSYDCEVWTDDEVKVVLHGERLRGRYVLFATGGKNWMIHRMDPPQQPGREPIPDLVRPMLATPGDLPSAAEDGRWAYEPKWDGVRAVCYVDGGRLRLMSRNDRDLTRGYPEVRGLGAALGSVPAIVDGELVAFDPAGRTSFARLQERMQVTEAAAVRRLAEQVPVVYLIFDLLHLDGRSTLTLPYADRRALLEALELSGPAWQTPDRLSGTGAQALAASRENGWEGVVAKSLRSTYRPGRRSPDWRKIKNLRTQEVVVAGWRPGQGRRAGGVGALVLGVNDDRGLQYAGGVGTGFTEAMLADLGARLAPLERTAPPFVDPPPRAQTRDVHWVAPTLVGEVAFTEWTGDRRLRHPTWRGLRPDKEPGEVVREDG